MIIHEAVSMAEPMVTLVDEGQNVEKCLPILVVLEYGLFIITPISDVIYCPRIFYA